MTGKNDKPLPEIPGWTLLGVLGRGGMGVVYLARSKTVAQPVALKVIHAAYADQPAFRRYFIREISTSVSLHHPHILPVLNYSPDPDVGLLYFATPVVGEEDCRSLADLLSREGNLSPTLTAALLAQVSDALAYAHGQDPPVVHRDISPSNVLLRKHRSGSYQALLADFGIAFPSVTEARLSVTQPDSVIPGGGKPEYMAPEQFDDVEFGPITPKTDLYQLGILAYECLTGSRPYQETNAFRYSDAHRRANVPILTEEQCPVPEWRSLVAELMAKRPEDRPENAAVVRDRLFDIARSNPATHSPDRDSTTGEPDRYVTTIGPAPVGYEPRELKGTPDSPAHPATPTTPTTPPTVIQPPFITTGDTQSGSSAKSKSRKRLITTVLIFLLLAIPATFAIYAVRNQHLLRTQFAGTKGENTHTKPEETRHNPSTDEESQLPGGKSNTDSADNEDITPPQPNTDNEDKGDESDVNDQGENQAGEDTDANTLNDDQSNGAENSTGTVPDDETQPRLPPIMPGPEQQRFRELLNRSRGPKELLLQTAAPAENLFREANEAQARGDTSLAAKKSRLAEEAFADVITRWRRLAPRNLWLQIDESEEKQVRITITPIDSTTPVLTDRIDTEPGFHLIAYGDDHKKLTGLCVVSVTTVDGLMNIPTAKDSEESVLFFGDSSYPDFPSNARRDLTLYVPALSDEQRNTLHVLRGAVQAEARSNEIFFDVEKLLALGEKLGKEGKKLAEDVKDSPDTDIRRYKTNKFMDKFRDWHDRVELPAKDLFSKAEEQIEIVANAPGEENQHAQDLQIKLDTLKKQLETQRQEFEEMRPLPSGSKVGG